MNYNVPLDHPTIATVPQHVFIDGGAEASAGLGHVFVESRQYIADESRIKYPVSDEFKKYEKEWKRDTQYSSSLTDKYLHPSYARIIGIGQPAVPLILRSLKQQPNDWFYALRAITGANPVRSADAGDMQKMSQAWLAWGRERGL